MFLPFVAVVTADSGISLSWSDYCHILRKNSHFAVDPSLRLDQKTDVKWDITIFETIS